MVVLVVQVVTPELQDLADWPVRTVALSLALAPMVLLVLQ